MSGLRANEKRIILEMGMGNDLYGGNYTKAACRAVQDALHHSSISLFKSLGFNSKDMRVQVTIAVQEPEKIDVKTVEAELPRGVATVTAVKGGLNVPDMEAGQAHVVATAAIEAFLPVNAANWKLSS